MKLHYTYQADPDYYFIVEPGSLEDGTPLGWYEIDIYWRDKLVYALSTDLYTDTHLAKEVMEDLSQQERIILAITEDILKRKFDHRWFKLEEREND